MMPIIVVATLLQTTDLGQLRDYKVISFPKIVIKRYQDLREATLLSSQIGSAVSEVQIDTHTHTDPAIHPILQYTCFFSRN